MSRVAVGVESHEATADRSSHERKPWLTPEPAAQEPQVAVGRKNVVVTPSKVRSWLRTGELIGQRVNGEWRFYPQDIRAKVKDQQRRRDVHQAGRFGGR